MAGLGANSVKGTIFKLNVNMDPIDNNHMEDVDWEAKVFTENGSKFQIIRKADARKVDADNYIIAVDSGIVGPGKYYLTLTANIADADVEGGVRPEIRTGFTGVTIDAR